MENVDMKVDGDRLTITVNLKNQGAPSKTGKTILVATTRGAMPIEHKRGITVALNVMAKR